jgi:hypothetical protein
LERNVIDDGQPGGDVQKRIGVKTTTLPIAVLSTNVHFGAMDLRIGVESACVGSCFDSILNGLETRFFCFVCVVAMTSVISSF